MALNEGLFEGHTVLTAMGRACKSERRKRGEKQQPTDCDLLNTRIQNQALNIRDAADRLYAINARLENLHAQLDRSREKALKSAIKAILQIFLPLLGRARRAFRKLRLRDPDPSAVRDIIDVIGDLNDMVRSINSSRKLSREMSDLVPMFRWQADFLTTQQNALSALFAEREKLGC